MFINKLEAGDWRLAASFDQNNIIKQLKGRGRPSRDEVSTTLFGSLVGKLAPNLFYLYGSFGASPTFEAPANEALNRANKQAKQSYKCRLQTLDNNWQVDQQGEWQ